MANPSPPPVFTLLPGGKPGKALPEPVAPPRPCPECGGPSRPWRAVDGLVAPFFECLSECWAR